jgi:hypothetical protein
MRPASPPGAVSPEGEPPNGSPVDLPEETGDEPSRSSSRRRRWPWVVLASVVALGLAAGVVVLTHRPTHTGAHPRTSPGSSPQPPFAFASATVKAVSVTGGGRRQAAAGVAGSVRTTLSGFYQAAFVDPEAWTGAVPSEAWNAFAPATRRQAQGDAASLTLGTVDGKIASLRVTASSLTVTVLFDENGRPQSAFADVNFEANAALEAGESLQVTNKARFYLQPISGSWLVTGYPSAHTDLIAPAPAASGSPSPSSPSPSPTGTG